MTTPEPLAGGHGRPQFPTAADLDDAAKRIADYLCPTRAGDLDPRRAADEAIRLVEWCRNLLADRAEATRWARYGAAERNRIGAQVRAVADITDAFPNQPWAQWTRRAARLKCTPGEAIQGIAVGAITEI